MKSLRLAAAAGLLCIGVESVPACAQTAGPGGKTVYEGAYFATFSPSTALDIVQRVPGFTLDIGEQEVRGFSQAAGNVVINGARPSSKADTLETILARIPAKRVARVEVGPGELFGSEYSGRAQVLNLILTSEGGLAGTVNATVRRNFRGRFTPEGTVSALYRRGGSSFNLSAGVTNADTPEEGTDHLITLPDREFYEFRRKRNDIRDREGFVSGSWENEGGPNRTAHLNFRIARGGLKLNQENDVVPLTGPLRDDRLSQDFRRRNFEIGGDVTRPLLGGGIKLIGLATRRHRLYDEISLNRVQSKVVGGYSQDQDNRLSETVLRLVWNHPDIHGWSVETGAEGVLNELKSDVNFYELDASGGRTRIDLPVDQATVREWRGEAFVNAGRSLSATSRIDLGVTYEASRLTVRGDAEAERMLRFIKPKFVYDWRPKGGAHFQLSIARTVAQLDFFDFISSAELTNDRVNGGNPDLVPQRSWEILATVEQPILGDGLVKVEAGYNRVSLVQDRVPTPEGFDAPGNLGSGNVYILRSTIDAPLAKFGAPGARFTVHSSLVKTDVEDPYTHRRRAFSGNAIYLADASFRQDLGKFAWGLTAYFNTPSRFFRRNEIDKQFSQSPYVTAFIDYRPTAKTTVTFSLDNAFDVRAFRNRTYFSPDRTNPSPWLFEHRERNRHVTPAISIKHSFG